MEQHEVNPFRVVSCCAGCGAPLGSLHKEDCSIRAQNIREQATWHAEDHSQTTTYPPDSWQAADARYATRPKSVTQTLIEAALAKQEGGDHYKRMALQPWEIIDALHLNFYEGNALKYLLRYRDKGGVESLKKAIHYIEKMIADYQLEQLNGDR